MRDPLYKRILEGLANQELDWKSFESCMCYLLRDDLPGLVPVGGSGDFGMDGEIADGEAEPYPLICTTDTDIIGNLTRNLARYLEQGWPARKVAVATSRSLTPHQRKNLKARARDKGFVLIQLFDRRALANRLYRDPMCRLDLLGISGSPSALTAVPRSRRPLIEIALLGRDGDIDWLKNTDGDRVLLGQPGSGKTFLLYHLIHRLKWNALFLDVDSNRGEIADALRELAPRVVVVDDAHLAFEALERLISVRSQTGTRFSIVATTWPSSKDRVVEALGGDVQVRGLELLTRREIEIVIQRVGVTGLHALELQRRGDDQAIRQPAEVIVPDYVMSELIDQSAQKPGLAVTLAWLMIQGHHEEVLDGSALKRTLLYGFPHKTHQLLAALGLGGDRGMRLEDAREYLDIPRGEAMAIAGELSGLGVLEDRKEALPPFLRGPEAAALAVRPRSLRWQLVKSFFFESPRPGYRPLLEKALSRADAISTLLHAKARCGAAIGAEELGKLVRSDESRELWELLAQVGKDEALWTMENYPGDVLCIAREVLATAPAAALERLLTRAAELASEERHRPDPWEILSAWVTELEELPGVADQVLRRRDQLASAGEHFLLRDRATGTAALFVALNPGLQGMSLDPAAGETLTLRWALLSRPELGELAEIWRRVRSKLTILDAVALARAEDTLWHWVHPEASSSGDVPEKTKRFMREVAAEILHDLAPLVAHSPGLTSRLEQLARRCGVELSLAIDPIFKLLYPDFGELGLRRDDARASRLEPIRRLSQEWKQRPAPEVGADLAFYENEARLASGERFSDLLARELSREVAEPAAWFEAFLGQGLHALASAFTEQIVTDRRHGWQQHLERCFDLAPQLRFSAAEQVLQLQEPPRKLMDRAMSVAEELPWLVETLALRRLLPVATLRLFLRHPCWQVALAAAVGECNMAGTGAFSDRVRDVVRADWWQAVLRAKSPDDEGVDLTGLGSWLQTILMSDPQLAFEWLDRRLGEPDLPGWFLSESAFAGAARALTLTRKEQLLARLPDIPIAGSLVGCLVGRDPELYRRLLARTELRAHHLMPLLGVPNESWTNLAVLALDAGYTPDAIARASGPSPNGEPAFTRLADHPDPRLQEVATLWFGMSSHRGSGARSGSGSPS